MRRNKGEILKILLDEKASKDNTICLNSYGNGIIDAISFIDKEALKEPIDVLIEWIETSLKYDKMPNVDINTHESYVAILTKAKEIKQQHEL